MGIASLIVRAATPADADDIALLINTLGYSLPPDEVRERTIEIEDAGNRILVAELDDRVVGCLTTSVMAVLHRPAKVGRISLLVVEEDLRSQGIGRALVKEAEAFFARSGHQIVEVTSRADRTRAHSFYERLGYEKTSVRLARNLSD